MKNHNSRLILRIGVAMLGRVVSNTARRFVYPFAPALARGLGVPLPAVTSLIAVNVYGRSGFFLYPLGDCWGYRIMLLVGLGTFIAGDAGSSSGDTLLVHFRGIDVGEESEPFRVSSALLPNSITRGIIEHFDCSKDPLGDCFPG